MQVKQEKNQKEKSKKKLPIGGIKVRPTPSMLQRIPEGLQSPGSTMSTSKLEVKLKHLQHIDERKKEYF